MILKPKYYVIVLPNTDIAQYNTPDGKRYISFLAQAETDDGTYIERVFYIGADSHSEFDQSWNMDGDGTTENVLNWRRELQADLVMYELSTTNRASDGNGCSYCVILREIHYPPNTQL